MSTTDTEGLEQPKLWCFEVDCNCPCANCKASNHARCYIARVDKPTQMQVDGYVTLPLPESNASHPYASGFEDECAVCGKSAAVHGESSNSSSAETLPSAGRVYSSAKSQPNGVTETTASTNASAGETVTLANKQFSVFNDELVNRYFNDAGKAAIAAYIAARTVDATPPAPSVPTVGGELRELQHDKLQTWLEYCVHNNVGEDGLVLIDLAETRDYLTSQIVPYLAARQLSTDEARPWVSVFDSSDRPRDGEQVLCRLVWPSGKEVYSVLVAVNESDCSWRTADGNSELTYDVSVTHWQRIAALRTDKDREVAE